MTLHLHDRYDFTDDFRFAIVVGDGESPPTIELTEYLEWHVETFPDLMAPLLDEDGWLTPEALAAVEAAIRAELVELDPTYADRELFIEDGLGGDEPNFMVGMALAVTHEATEDAAWQDAWPFIATGINVTDPGTFSSPYLFDHVARLLEEARSEH